MIRKILLFIFYRELCYNYSFKKGVNQGWSQLHFNPGDSEFNKFVFTVSANLEKITAQRWAQWQKDSGSKRGEREADRSLV